MRQHLTFPVRELRDAAEAEIERTVLGSLALMMMIWPDLNDSMNPIGAPAVYLDESIRAGLLLDHFTIRDAGEELRIFGKSKEGKWFIRQFNDLEEYASKYYRHPFPELLRSLSGIGKVGRVLA